MEHVAKDFGTGLLDYVRRSPDWDPDTRMPVRIGWVTAVEEGRPSRLGTLVLVPLVAAFFAGRIG